VTTAQGPQPQTTIQGPPRRYPVPLPLRYRAASKRGIALGFGQAIMMSSQDITFAAGNRLEPGMEAQIAIAWPFLLDGRIPQQLVLDATITASQNGVAEAHILAYDFRTAGPAEANHRDVLQRAPGLLVG
jgi:hypothetical protein